MLVSKIAYGKIIKGLDHYRKQHEEDRAEKPHLSPMDWGGLLALMIEQVLRENRERCPRDLPPKMLEYLASKGLIVPYAGGYTFPQKDPLPAAEELKQEALKHLKELLG